MAQSKFRNKVLWFKEFTAYRDGLCAPRDQFAKCPLSLRRRTQRIEPRLEAQSLGRHFPQRDRVVPASANSFCRKGSPTQGEPCEALRTRHDLSKVLEPLVAHFKLAEYGKASHVATRPSVRIDETLLDWEVRIYRQNWNGSGSTRGCNHLVWSRRQDHVHPLANHLLREFPKSLPISIRINALDDNGFAEDPALLSHLDPDRVLRLSRSDFGAGVMPEVEASNAFRLSCFPCLCNGQAREADQCQPHKRFPSCDQSTTPF